MCNVSVFFVRERFIVHENKNNLVVQGMGYSRTSIEWNNTTASSNGTFSSFSVAVFGEKFTAYNISFKVISSVFCSIFLLVLSFLFHENL